MTSPISILPQPVKLTLHEGRFAFNAKTAKDGKLPLEDLADAILYASYEKGLDLYSIEELSAQVQVEVANMFKEYPGSRIRLKAIGGGGGKGQRILGASLLTAKNPTDKQIKEAAAEAPTLVREVLNEVKATGIGDNKNVLVELNIEQTRHNLYPDIFLSIHADYHEFFTGRPLLQRIRYRPGKT